MYIANSSLLKENGYYLAFFKNPMIITLGLSANDIPADANAAEVTLFVTVNGTEYPFSTEVTNSSSFVFEIGSAWEDEYSKSEVSPNEVSYDVLKGSVEYQISYIKNKEFVKTYKDRIKLYDNIFALRGGVSERDILLNNWTKQLHAVKAFKNHLTRMPGKPTVNVGDTYYKSVLNLASSTAVDEGAAHNVECTMTKIENQSYDNLIVVNDANRQEFRFINSFGVIESISCVCLEAYAVNLSQVQHRIVGRPSYVPTGYTKNISQYKDSYTMSSGFMSPDWLEWFSKEFLNSPRHWMRIKGTDKLLPVAIKAKEDNTIYDKTKAELNEIQFDVTL